MNSMNRQLLFRVFSLCLLWSLQLLPENEFYLDHCNFQLYAPNLSNYFDTYAANYFEKD